MAYRRFKLPQASPAPATVAAVATHDPQNGASVATVAAPQSDFSDWNEDDWHATFAERAAILEYDGGYARDHAERMALEEIRKQRNGGRDVGDQFKIRNQQKAARKAIELSQRSV